MSSRIAIHYSALRSLKARQMVAALNQDGFFLVRQRGDLISATLIPTAGR